MYLSAKLNCFIQDIVMNLISKKWSFREFKIQSDEFTEVLMYERKMLYFMSKCIILIC